MNWVIGLDTHCAFTVAAVIGPDGGLAKGLAESVGLGHAFVVGADVTFGIVRGGEANEFGKDGRAAATGEAFFFEYE